MKISLHQCAARHPAAATGAPPVLLSLNLQIAQGEQLAVIGPSGAGKTTLLLVLACALKPAQGHLTLDGRDPWALGTRELQSLRGHLFLAPQVPPLPPRQRVVTSVLAGCLPHMGLAQSLRSLVYPAHTPLAHAALARFDLAEKLFDRVDRLSGGERQRVGLARLAVADAQLLLVDEPLSALDPERARQAIASIQAVAHEKSATLIATLHHVEMALRHFPRIIGLQAGALAFDLAAAAVTPAHLEALYASHPEELTGAALVETSAPALPAAEAALASARCR